MRKFLFILPSNLIGGAETLSLNLVKSLSSKGHAVTVVFLSTPNMHFISPWDELVNIDKISVNAKSEKVGFIKFFLRLIFNRFIKGNQFFDFSFSTHLHCNAFIYFITRLKLISVHKIVVRESTNFFSWHTGLKLKVVKFLYRFYPSNPNIICQTNQMRNELVSNVFFKDITNIKTFRNPINVNYIMQKSEDFVDFSGFYSKKNDNKVILSVGRLVPEKSFETLISSLAYLHGYCCVILGDGPELKSLMKVAIDVGVADKVHFVGEVSNPYKYMARADICVVSSKLEGFPNVLHEQMCLSNKIVSTICTDEINLLPGITVVPIEDPYSLALAIKNVSNLTIQDELKLSEIYKSYVSSQTLDNYISSVFYK